MADEQDFEGVAADEAVVWEESAAPEAQEILSEEDRKAREQTERRLQALRKDGMKLGRLPEEERTPELCAAALRQNGLALQFVPEAARDMYLCQKAVRSAGLALEFVPQALRARGVCLTALRQEGLALRFVPEDGKDRELCLTALRQRGEALRHVPAALLDTELCRQALRGEGCALEAVPENLRNADLCYEACRQSGLALRHVPEALRTSRLTARALLSADAERRRKTSISCEVPPNWEELKKTKPKEEWGRYENWHVTVPEEFPFPEELALPAEEIASVFRELADGFVEAAGGFPEGDSGPGRGVWLEASSQAGTMMSLYAPALRLLQQGETDGRGLPVQAGARTAAAQLLDWAAGWREDPAES